MLGRFQRTTDRFPRLSKFLKTEPSTLESGLERSDTVTGFRYGLTTQNMKVSGKMIRLMGEESFIMQTETSMMESGKTTKLMERGSIHMQTELYMTDSGLMTNNTAMVLKAGQMVLDTKASTLMERKKEEVLFTLQMDLFLMASSKATKSMGSELTNGLTERSMTVNGSIIKCAEEVL